MVVTVHFKAGPVGRVLRRAQPNESPQWPGTRRLRFPLVLAAFPRQAGRCASQSRSSSPPAADPRARRKRDGGSSHREKMGEMRMQGGGSRVGNGSVAFSCDECCAAMCNTAQRHQKREEPDAQYTSRRIQSAGLVDGILLKRASTRRAHQKSRPPLRGFFDNAFSRCFCFCWRCALSRS